MPGSGWLAVYLPGMQPDHIRTKIDLCNGQPHTIAMQYEPRQVWLFVDGVLAGESPIEPTGATSTPGELAFGRLVEGSLGCDGTLDYVHLRRGIHAPVSAKNAPDVGSDTLGLWQLASAAGGRVADLSPAKNDARATAAPSAKSNAVVPPPGNQITAADPKLKVVLLDRSADDVFMAVKVDSEGQVFVGGRKALFAFEPDKEGYRAKRELLRFPEDSIIIGLEFRGNDLYVLTSNACIASPKGGAPRWIEARANPVGIAAGSTRQFSLPGLGARRRFVSRSWRSAADLWRLEPP